MKDAGSQLFLAIEIGGTKLQMAAGNGRGQIQQRWRHDVNPARGGVGIREQIEQTWREIAQSGLELAGIGTGFGGPVDSRTGRIKCSHQIEGWADFHLAEWLTQISGLPAHVDNDANVASLGEASLGAGRNANPVFYVTMGSGVGGGLVVDGHIYHGAVPGEAEIGHIRLDRAGAIVETRCSGWAVDARIRDLQKTDPQSTLVAMTRHMGRGEARCLGPACDQGDVAALRLLNETAEDLAFGLSHVTHLFHPEIIVLGGGLSLVGERLRHAVAEALPRFVMKAFTPGPRIVLAGLGEDAVPCGALVLASQFMTRND